MKLNSQVQRLIILIVFVSFYSQTCIKQTPLGNAVVWVLNRLPNSPIYGYENSQQRLNQSMSSSFD